MSSSESLEVLERRAWREALLGFGQERFIVQLRMTETSPQMLETPGSGEAAVLPLSNPIKYTCIGPARELVPDSGLFELRIPILTPDAGGGKPQPATMLLIVHVRDLLTAMCASPLSIVSALSPPLPS